MEHISYLFAAFLAVWLIVFVYLFSLSRRQQHLVNEVEALRRLMEQKGESQ